jgi:hypothetical protein
MAASYRIGARRLVFCTTAEHVYEALDVDPDARWKLPAAALSAGFLARAWLCGELELEVIT